ncbi:MAG TPA: MFS transporter [Longimicrobiales bacterium]
MSLWFTASAVTPYLQSRWHLNAAEAGWLTTVVQLGFVAGPALAAVLNLADVWSARWLVAASCLLAAGANSLVLAADSFGFALLMRFLTGLFLAGVYPPGMKMMATWFVTNRGLAIGALVGALTVGKALPYLVRALHDVSPSFVILSASAGALAAALLVALLYRDGPHAFQRRPFSWKLIATVVRHRETRLAIAGYLGHMWELYAMWSLIAVFFFEKFAATSSAAAASAYSGVSAFAVIGAGAVGSVIAGKWADDVGRERVTIWSMIVSGACALSIGWLYAAPLWFLLLIALIWGAAVVADSAQFSAIVTEVSPKHAVGTALTLQTSLGFLLTAFTIWLTIRLHAHFDWRVAFGMLAIGPVLGIVAMARLRRVRGA